MSKMVLHKRVGLFHVEITGFQSDCLPYPQKVLEAVACHLPVIAAKRNDVLLNVIKVRCFFFPAVLFKERTAKVIFIELSRETIADYNLLFFFLSTLQESSIKCQRL